MLAIAAAGDVRLWLHGHRHSPYFFDNSQWAPFPAICAGSGTQTGTWSYNEYTIEGALAKVVRRAYDPKTQRFQDVQEFENRAHFLAISAQLMRQILVEYARGRNAAKRNAGYRVVLDDTVNLFKARSVVLVSLDDALKELARLDPRQSRVVELRFFGGLSTEETAVVLGISSATVKRDWSTARIWLRHQMTRSGSHDPGALATG